MKAGNRTIERCDVICPFCLLQTGRWKMIPAIWEWNTRHTELTPEPINRQSAQEWEAQVLREHLPSCSMKSTIGIKLLKLYHLGDMYNQ